jgi:hypothetical protein
LLDVVVPRVIGLVQEIPVPRLEFKSEGEWLWNGCIITY